MTTTKAKKKTRTPLVNDSWGYATLEEKFAGLRKLERMLNDCGAAILSIPYFDGREIVVNIEARIGRLRASLAADLEKKR